jgi:hypothetical protein
MSPLPHRLPAAWLTLALLAVAAGPALAQDPSKVSKEREALRRAQASLQQTQAERDALVGEKASWSTDRETLQSQLAQGQARHRGLQARNVQALAEATRLQAELVVARTAVASAATAAEAGRGREAALQQDLLAARTESAGRAQTVAALRGLLERSVAALAAAETANTQLLVAGLDAVARLRSKTPEDLAALNEPMLGLRAVQIDNEAEALRSQIDRYRLPLR